VPDRLLLVGDDADVVGAIGEYLERIGYAVHREQPGGGAVDAFARERPDVVILVGEKVRPTPQDELLRGRHTPQTLSEVERHHIERTLKAHGGNRTRAAQELAISRATLINKIKTYRLDV
jgi:DNA-binding NtrC family response regulator